MASNREKKLKLREAQIMRSAVKLIDESGFAMLTMDQLAAESGVAKATLYQHFRSKDELFIAMTKTALQQLADHMESLSGPAILQLQSIMRFLMRSGALLEDHPPMTMHEDILHLFRSNESVGALFWKLSEQLFTLIRQAQADGEISADYSEAFVVSMIMTNVGVIRGRAVYSEAGLTAEKIIDNTAKILFTGLK